MTRSAATDNLIRRYTFKLYPNVEQLAALERMRALHSALYNALIEQRITAYTHPSRAEITEGSGDAKVSTAGPQAAAKILATCKDLRPETAARLRDLAKSSPALVPAIKLRRRVEFYAVDSTSKPGLTWWRTRSINVYEPAGPTLTLYDQSAEITALRAALPEYRALSAVNMHATGRRVDLAFKAFFRRAKQGAGPQSGFPRYKRCDGFGFNQPNNGWNFAANRLRMQAVPGLIRARGKFPATPIALKTCDLLHRAGTWWLSVVAEMPARMRKDASHSGEIEFDLIDSFARVRRADGGHPAGPEETVYAAADGRIIYPNQGSCTLSGVDTHHSEGNGGIRPEAAASTSGVDTHHSEGNGGHRSSWAPGAWGVDTHHSEGNGGRQTMTRADNPGVDTHHSEGNGGCDERVRGSRRGVGTRRSEGSGGVGSLRPGSLGGVDTHHSEGNGGAEDYETADAIGVGTHRSEGNGGQVVVELLQGGGVETPHSEDKGGSIRARLQPSSTGTEGSRRLKNGDDRLLDKSEKLQRAMSRCKRGSCKYRALRMLRARREARTTRQRRESQHLWTTRVARRFASLHIIVPPIVEASRTGAGDEREWGARVRDKAHINRRILMQSPAVVVQMLTYKLRERGGSCEATINAEAKVMVGNEIVAAAKASRKVRNIARKPKKDRRHGP